MWWPRPFILALWRQREASGSSGLTGLGNETGGGGGEQRRSGGEYQRREGKRQLQCMRGPDRERERER